MPKEKTAHELAAARARVEELERKAAEEDAMPPDQRLAEDLHDAHCRWNHIDQCDWAYGSNWTSGSRRRYLAGAEAILSITDADTALAVIKIMKSTG